MTRDEIIGIAFKAGFPDWWLHPPEPERQDGEVLAMLGRFAALVAAAEREACAKECENHKVGLDSYFEIDERIQECAAAIRARSST